MQSVRTETGVEIAGFGAQVFPLVYRSPAGRMELLIATLGRLSRWDVDSGELLDEFEVSEGGAGVVTGMAVVVLPDGRVRIASGEEDGFSLWDGVSGRLLVAADWDDQVFRVSGGVLENGQGLFVAGGPAGLYRWDAATGQQLGPPLEHPGEVVTATLATLSDGTSLIATGDYEGVRRWRGSACERSVGEPIAADYVLLLTTAYMTDGRVLLVGAVDDGQAVRRWDAETGDEVGPLISTPEMVVGMALASVSGRMRLFTVDETDTVRQWDLLTGAPVGETFAGRAVSAVSSPDGSALLAVGTRDGKLATHQLT